MKKSVIIIAVILLIAIIAGGFFLFNATATNELEEALSSKNADLVNSIYSEASGNEKLLIKYDKVISETIEDIRNDINNHDFKDEAVTEGGEAVENYCINNWGTLILSDENDLWESISSENWNAWEELLDLIDSKGHYCDGIYYFTNGDYEYSIFHFSSVIDSDSVSADAQKMIQESVDSYFNSILQTVEECIANGDFSGGLALLENVKQYLDECGLNSDAISNKIDETLAEYAASYVAKAEEAFNEHDVNAAIANIEVAIELQPDNGEYKTKYNTYQQYIPFELYISDNCYSVDGTGEFWGTLAFDINRESNNDMDMPHSMKWYNNSSDSTATISANYDLGGKYDTVKGIFFLPKNERDTSFKGWFKVYGDGKLLYESDKMTGGVLPKEFSINVTGVQKLKISFYGEGSGGFLSYGSDFCISNLIAQKNFPN